MKRKAKFRRMVACDTGPNEDYQVKVYARVYQSGKIVVYREEVTRREKEGKRGYKCSAKMSHRGAGRHLGTRRCERPIFKDGLCKLHSTRKEKSEARERLYDEHLKKVFDERSVDKSAPSKWALEKAILYRSGKLRCAHSKTMSGLAMDCNQCLALEFDAIARERDEVTEKLAEALQGIIDIGKRDLKNPKYDGYFISAKEALVYHERRGR